MKRLVVGLLSGSCLLVAGVAATFDGPDYEKLKTFLPPGPDAALCFTRTYDAAHLKTHPHQTVTEMVLSLRYTTLGPDEAISVATDDGGTLMQDFRYDFTLAAKTRDHDQTLYASGDCASWKEIGCDVECDGGGIGIEPKSGGTDEILVRLERIRMSLGCADGPDVELTGGKDDKVFKLSKAPQAVCDSMEAEAQK